MKYLYVVGDADQVVDGFPVYLNRRDEDRFGLVQRLTVSDLIRYAKESQLGAYHAWLDMQIERGKPTAFQGAKSDHYLKQLPDDKRDIVQDAIARNDSSELLNCLELMRFSNYEDFIATVEVQSHREKVVIKAIEYLHANKVEPTAILDALLSLSCVFPDSGPLPRHIETLLQSAAKYRKFLRPQVNAFASYLAGHGFLLYPTKFRDKNVGTALQPSRYKPLSGPQFDIHQWFVDSLRDVQKLKGDQLRWASTMMWYLIKITNATEPAHLTPKIMRLALERTVPEPHDRGAGSRHTRSVLKKIVETYSLFLDTFNPAATADLNVSAFISLIAAPRPQERQAEDFRWLQAKRPDLVEWRELAAAWRASGKVRVSNTAIYGLNHFLDFLVQGEDPILNPRDFTRKHFVNEADYEDVQTLWGYVLGLRHKHNPDQPIGQATKNRVLASAQELLEFFADQEVIKGNPEYIVPITTKDRMDWGLTTGKSVRQALPVRLLNRMKQVILSPDAKGCPTFAWAKQESSDWVQVVNRETGRVETVYYPGRAILLYLLLATPLRSFQARWLDSGELDAQIYSSVEQKMVRNPSPHAIKGKVDGVLRSMPLDYGEGEYLGLWINTNKTGIYEPGKIQGYGIPWCDETVQSLIQEMQDWHSKYYGVGSSIHPPLVRLYEGEKRGLTERIFKMMPEFVPLFRDPGSSPKRSQDHPISSWRLRCFFAQVLAETELQFREEGERLSLVDWQDADAKASATPGVLVQPTKVTPKVDLHTLRVTGITALIDAGVPAHIVSEFVAGHASVIMTLYYHHHGPTKVREILSRAYDNLNSEDFDLDGLTTLYDNRPDEAARYFLTQDGAAPGNTAFTTLKSNQGVATVSHSGICPGANCDEGGPLLEGKTTPVPGGPGNCGQCRFWITGPAFLVGQVMEANSLMYHIRDKAEELKAIRDAAKRARLNHEPVGRINLLAGRAEKAERELTSQLTEWGARYRYIVVSNQLLDDWQSSGSSDRPTKALVSSADASELRAMARKVSNLEMLHALGVQSQVFPEMSVSPGSIAELELTIAQILARNNMDGLLLRLSKSERLSACNLFAETILDLTAGDDQTINNILDGSLSLSALNGWHEQAEQLINHCITKAEPKGLIFRGEPA